MRFTLAQYKAAIKDLEAAKTQLEPDGYCCAVCGDSGHMAFECGFNPLVAVALCVQITQEAEQLHNTLHTLAGHDFYMGVQLGPKRIVSPYETND